MKGETAAHPENRFALFGMQVFAARILFRKPLRTFRDAGPCRAHLAPKTASHFSRCGSLPRASCSENRFALFGMRYNLTIRRFLSEVPISCV
ncbi:hypothetical protein AVM02_17085 [Brucella anthropi]